MTHTFTISDEEYETLRYILPHCLILLGSAIEEKTFYEPQNIRALSKMEDTMLNLECICMNLFEGGEADEN